MKIAFLLVTCCLEESRANILIQVIKNLNEQVPDLKEVITVFDNMSTEISAKDLSLQFENVYQSSQNVGYWSAIDWWLESLSADPPDYTYIIESDMIHYNFNKLWSCAQYLDDNPDVGSVRLHEYSVANRHLFNKDRPRQDSKTNLWQSHTNKVTGYPVKLDHSSGDIWSTTFLTQLPALNRYSTMKDVFRELRTMPRFSELDFQRLYWQRYNRTGILDGGIFNCDLNPYGTDSVTGSWTDETSLNRLGYKTTRVASIISTNQYIVTKL